MFPTLLRKLHEISRLLIVRVLLIAFLSVFSIFLAWVFGRYIPDGLDGMIGADAVDRILAIIANSMLTVTTFSLTVMAATHRAVSSLWTPRAHQILLQDTTTHTVLATFVGAYLYALIAIILRETKVFAGPQLVLLFSMTLIVALLIVIAIIRWIQHLEMLGSLIETSERIERQTTDAWLLRGEWPTLGAHGPEGNTAPEGAFAVRAETTGYLQQIYQDRIQDAAEKADARVWIEVSVGQFVYRGDVLARTDREDDELTDKIVANLALGGLRNFAQDPEFGLLCLSEIASRAMSPGINDPGTAIDSLRRMARVILSFNVPLDGSGHEVLHDRLTIPRFDPKATLFETFGPVGRDSAGFIEVQSALRHSLRAIAKHPDQVLSRAADDLIDEVFDRAKGELTRTERARLEAI